MLRDRVLRHSAVAAAAVAALATAACLRPGDPTGARTTASAPGPDSPTTSTTTSTTTATATAPTSLATSTPNATAPADPWAAYSVPRGAWEAWRPVVTDVHEASDADLVALERRASAAQGREFTITVETFLGPGEFSHGRDHDRLRIGDESERAFEVHVEPLRPGEKGEGVFGMTGRAAVVCQQKACVRVTGAEDSGGAPHLFNTITDSALMQASILVSAQDDVMGLFPHARTKGAAVGTASVASPLGPLDCAVGAETPSDLKAMEGQVKELGSSVQETAMVCLDARGLVVLTADMAFPMVAYHSFRPGAAPDVADYPYPVRAYSS